jgi:hypothetical protein
MQRDTEIRWLNKGRFSSLGHVYPPFKSEKADKFKDVLIVEGLGDEDVSYSEARFFAIAPNGCKVVSAPEINSLAARDKFRRFVNSSRFLETPEDFEDFEDFAFLRCGLNSNAVECITHQALVGLFGTNSLRSSIPNFLYTYGCIVEPADSQCLIVESPRTPGQTTSTLGDFLEEMTAGEYYTVFMQLVYALKFASEKISFTHFNLSPTTVLMRPILRSTKDFTDVFISYEKGSVFVNATKYGVAVLSDFSRSHVSVRNSEKRNVSFGFCEEGKVGSEVAIGVFRDRANPMCDIYHLLVTSYMSGGAGVKEAVSTLMRYFNRKESVDTIVGKQIESSYNLPLTTNTRGYNFDELISVSKREARNSKWPEARFAVVSNLTAHKKAEVLLPGAGLVSPRFESVSASSPASKNTAVVPGTFFGFYDIYSSLLTKISSSADRDAVKGFSAAYINGYTEDSSAYNASFEDAKDSVIFHFGHVVGGLDAIEKNGGYCRPLSPQSLSRISIVLSAYAAIIELGRAAEYTTSLFWKSKDEDERPDEMIELSKMIKEALEAASRPVATIVSLIAEDCTSEECKYSKGLLETTKDLLKRTATAAPQTD